VVVVPAVQIGVVTLFGAGAHDVDEFWHETACFWNK
jgi:hypothetical protein